MKGHSTVGHAATGNGFAGAGWLRLALAASVALATLGFASDASEARTLRLKADKRQSVRKEPAVPAAKGQLLIAVSLGSQRLTVYDDGVPIAHSPVSSGTPGHPTPTGVFSIIQKNRHHRSNIYSGAPMPFMQRITWSGVALHAGVLPGYPASHGCIRLPNDFAARLWGLTKLGVRVVVTRHDVTPIPISHGRLAALQTPVMATGTDKRADLLRPSLDTDEPARSVQAAPMRTADASAGTVASDASNPPAEPQPGAATEPAASPVSPAPSPAADAASPPPAPPPAVAAAADASANLPAVPPAGEEVPDRPVPPATTASTTPEPSAPSADDTAKTVTLPAEPVPANAATAAVAPAAETAPVAETTSAIDLALPAAAAPAAQPAAMSAPAQAAAGPPPADVAAPPVVADPVMLAALPLEEVFVPPDRPARPLRTGPVSVFISRKDGRLYVRKRFDPLFSVPVAIRSDQPIGTHVYTASEGEGGAGLRWIAISLPAELPKAVKASKAAKAAWQGGRRGGAKVAAPPDVLPPPSTAAEALDRVDLPADVVAQIASLMSPGATIIISDQGLGYETGLETDFIVLSR